ncbi:hypothetical protein M8C21_023972 [Ambrosia artemisiifolia]|uniref:Uncharacterized protein n=1 Tax=Ambrosia artemisiifolia TaxID=4212 RepID=A0AAD5GNF8_AMBAR|nr:hypothetical protein M8C21_023972 [Ambrosia artemisiifolia]
MLLANKEGIESLRQHWLGLGILNRGKISRLKIVKTRVKQLVEGIHLVHKALSRRNIEATQTLVSYGYEHSKKGSRPLDRLSGFSRSVENASREYNDMKDTIQQYNVTWVNTRANEAYVQQLKEKNSGVGTR